MSDQAPIAMDALAGAGLGSRRIEMDESALMLYAVNVAGAHSDGMDLLFEHGVPRCPTYAFELNEWALAEMARAISAPRVSTLMSSLKLQVGRALPVQGTLDLTALVGNVWDNGDAAYVEVQTRCECFVVTTIIFVPERGGFGGPRRPRPQQRLAESDYRVEIPGRDDVLYRRFAEEGRLTQRPIQPGAMTLSRALLGVLSQLDATPDRLRTLEGRFVAPARAGEPLHVVGNFDGSFEVHGERGLVLVGGRVTVA